MESSAKAGLRNSLVPTGLAAASVSIALFTLGRMYSCIVVAATSIHWLLLVALIAGAHSQNRAGQAAQSGRLLPGQRVLVSLLFLVIVAIGVALTGGPTIEGIAPTDETLRLGLLMGGVAGASAIMSFFFKQQQPELVPDAVGLVKIGRIGVWLALFAAASVFAEYFEYPAFENQVAVVLLGVPVLLAIELLARGVFGFLRRPPAGAAFGTDLFLARMLGSSYNPLQSVFSGVEDTFGVDVRSSWALGFLRQVSAALILALGVFTWGLSCFVVIDESQQAVRERFGKVSPGEVLGSGLHVGLPRPFDRVRLVDTQRVRTIPLGFSGEKLDSDALWTQYHAAEEYNLLIGDGRDLVTVNAELQYRIGDVHAWIYGCQNPEEALETLAYRVLMEATVDRTLDEVLSKDIGSFAAEMHTAVQNQADQKGLGVEVVSLNLRGLHPPVVLAEEYQSVVAAQLDRKTYMIDAEAYRQSALPMAKAAALSAIRTSTAERTLRLALAKGEAIAFESLEAQYAANPDLYRFRSRLETLEEVLGGKSYHVIDARIEQDGGALWFLQ